MITDADTQKLLAAFKKVFPTKESLKEDLNDMRSQMLDSVDGKLKAQEKSILAAVDEKLKAQDLRFDAKLEKQTDSIIKDVAFTIAPLFDQEDKEIAKSRPKN